MKQNVTERHLYASIILAMAMMIFSQGLSAKLTYTPLRGSSGYSGYGCDKLFDGNVGTKWCTNTMHEGYDNGWWVIFKTSKATCPSSYTIITGDDTKNNYGRNWKTWKIYGANFDSDAAAQKDAAEWVLLDDKKNIGQDVIPAENFFSVTFDMTELNTDEYQYFMIYITEVFGIDGDKIVKQQMSEFAFVESDEIPEDKVTYTALGGTKSGWGNEFSYPSLVDDNISTKWCAADTHEGYDNGWWIVFKSSKPLLPDFYTLVTGDDTKSNYGRNWVDWKVYAANFTSDEEATKNAEGWVLIDEKNNIGNDILPAANLTKVLFSLGTTPSTEYSYFKIEITRIIKNNTMQMAEFAFGTSADLQAMCELRYNEYIKLADAVAQKSLLDAFKAKVEAFKSVENYQAYLDLTAEVDGMLAALNASISAYQGYTNEADRGFHLLEAYADHLTEDGKAKLNAYLKETVQPGGQFTNGSYQYIMANRALSTEEIQAETAFLQNMIQGAIKQEEEEPFDVTYVGVAGIERFTSYQCLFDGDFSTRWRCRQDDALFAFERGWWTIFKTSEPIKPTLYYLVTSGAWNENWKSWKIYGGNFNEEDVSYYTSEDWGAMQDGWTLIDEKKNVSPDQLPPTGQNICLFNLSEILTQSYQFFKIVVTETVDGAISSMSEFKFGNNATLAQDREKYIAECEAFDTEVVAQQSLIDQYLALLPTLKDSQTPSEILSIYKQLQSLQNAILASRDAYAAYQQTINDIRAYLAENPDLTPSTPLNTLNAYLEEDIEPNQTYTYGSYSYIMEHRLLNVAEVQNAATQASQMLDQVINFISDLPVILSGTPNWNNDPVYTKEKLFDGIEMTRWFMRPVDPDHPAYIVFKMPEPIAPRMYTLITGDDTGTYVSNQGRNWKTWTIYGANFASDAEAVEDSPEWVAIDKREGVGQDRLPGQSLVHCHFGFTEGAPDSYQYFKLVITEAFKGQDIQMAELIFGTEEDYHAYVAEAKEAADIDLDIVAQTSLLEEYETKWNELETINDLELFITRADELSRMRQEIQASAAQYAAYLDKKDAILAYLNEHQLEGEELQLLLTYLNDYDEPGDAYPRGTFQHVYDNHELSTSELAEEQSFMDEMLRQALKKGAAPGSDVTLLLANADFRNNLSGWTNSGFAVSGQKDLCPVASYHKAGPASVSQTLTGLKNGIYAVSMNGMMIDGDDFESSAYGAMLFAGENCVPLMKGQENLVSFSDAVDLDNCYITNADTWPYDMTLQDGYAPTSETGCSYAFSTGRYRNCILAEVKDGTLKLGVNVVGTGGNLVCHTFLGDFHLTYCGSAEEAGTQIAEVLEGQKHRAEFMTSYEVGSSDDFLRYPSYSNEIRQGLMTLIQSATQGQESIAEYSALFKEYDVCRKAYYAYLQALTAMEDVVYSGAVYPFTEEEKLAYSDIGSTIWYNILDGKYTTEEALPQTDLRQSTYYIVCYGIEPQMADNVYQVSTKDELRWIAYQVNNGNKALNVSLTNDIQMSANVWIPIGTPQKPFAGTFDGQGHTIDISTMNATSGYGGLFGYISGATVRNFAITGTLVCAGAINGPVAMAKESLIEGIRSSLHIDATASGLTHTAGIVGDLQDNSLVTLCTFDGTITVGPDNHDCFGGIAGYTNTGTITNCANYGTITFSNENGYVGGMFGYVNNANFGGFRNCLAVGTVKREGGESKVAGALCGWLRTYNAETIANNYWLAGCAERAAGMADLEANKSATAEELASGAICYALNQGQEEEVWFQTIGEDPYPVLDATHGRVVKNADGTFGNGTGIEMVQGFKSSKVQDIYDLSGRKIVNGKLPKGIYLINEKKVLVK